MDADRITLVFTTVMNELPRGPVNEDEEVQEGSDRADWERRSSKTTMAMVDRLHGIVQEFDPALALKYNKFTIGLAKDGRPQNIVICRPWKSTVLVTIRLPQSAELQSKLDAGGLEVVDFYRREAGYRVRLSGDDVEQRRRVLRDLVGMAYRNSAG